jgi:hypothetical protein
MGASNPSNASVGVFYAVVGLGLVILSDYAPKLVNGLLALILIGLILRNTGAVQGWISRGVGAASSNSKGQ